MSDTPGPWGPYRATIEDHLDSCADYLGRLRRSLAGEIAPDRHYFADKAHQLHNAARRMVRIVQDIDRWLGECGTTLEHDQADGTRLIGECTLPAGHNAAHNDDGAGRLVAGRITGELRDLADTVERVSQHFGWSAPTVDRGLTDAPGTIANSRDALANLAVSLDTIGRQTPGSPRRSAPSTSSPTPHSPAGPTSMCATTRRPALVGWPVRHQTEPRPDRDGANRGPSGRVWGELASRRRPRPHAT
jgi:hypothetical protein